MTSSTLPLIDSPQNPRIKTWKQQLAKRNSSLIAIESRHPIEEALKADMGISQMLALAPNALAAIQPLLVGNHASIECLHVSERVMATLASTANPPPLLALAQRPDFLPLQTFWHTVSQTAHAQQRPIRLLWLHQLQDPGNAGTLIRSARAFGIHGLLLTPPIVDMYSPKVIRATAGCGFGLPMAHGTPAELVHLPDELAKQPIHWAYTTGQHPTHPVTPYTQLAGNTPTVCVLGNEGKGLPNTLAHICQAALPKTHTTAWVTIPTAVESLNVAVSGSILMAHLHATTTAKETH